MLSDALSSCEYANVAVAVRDSLVVEVFQKRDSVLSARLHRVLQIGGACLAMLLEICADGGFETVDHRLDKAKLLGNALCAPSFLERTYRLASQSGVDRT